MIVVTTADWSATGGTLQRFERSKAGKKWKAVGAPFAVVVGKGGLGWGIGMVPTDSVRGASDPVKHEGDGKAPAGVFTLSKGFGYSPTPAVGAKMPYVPLSPAIECVDDTKSKFYNQVVDDRSVTPDWDSSEHMRRPDVLYTWGIVVDHNTGPAQPGAGSCIFMHVWLNPTHPTVGCTAMPQEQMEALQRWLDPARQPILVQLIAADYQRLRKPWQLPKLKK
jgi:D-alanyl-D-alanine dipeptidase